MLRPGQGRPPEEHPERQKARCHVTANTQENSVTMHVLEHDFPTGRRQKPMFQLWQNLNNGLVGGLLLAELSVAVVNLPGGGGEGIIG